jgi:hypothetical protein
MPRKRMPRDTEPPPPSNGENGEGEPPPIVDISEMQTGWLASPLTTPTARARLFEEQAAQHDVDAQRLGAWSRQLRAWLAAARPAIAPAQRRLHWLRGEARLSRGETHELHTLADWLDAKQREIVEAESALDGLTGEILLHRSAAARLRAQKAAPGDTNDTKQEPPPPQPKPRQP